MDSVSSDQPVLIVGAGLAGLAFAQILRKEGVPFRIFERDAAEHVRHQGWAVMLMECIDSLLELLPADLGDLKTVSVNHHTSDEDSIAVVHHNSLETLAEIGGMAPGQPGYAIRADREHLRDFLWKDLDVEGGKNFEHYEEDANGVTAFFKDGTSARGSVLFGCDGGHSHIRTQLLHEGPVLSKYINILGQGDIPAEVYQPIRDMGTVGVIGVGEGIRILLGQRYMKPDLSAAGFYWVVSYQVDDPESESKWVEQATQEQLYDKVMEELKDTDELISRFVKLLGPKSIFTPPLKFIEYVPPENMPAGRVSLMGDALHTMIPFRAAGANTALKDACDLGRLVAAAKAQKGRVDWSDVLAKFHAIAIPRGREMVLTSRAAGESIEVGKKTLSHGRVEAK